MFLLRDSIGVRLSVLEEAAGPIFGEGMKCPQASRFRQGIEHDLGHAEDIGCCDLEVHRRTLDDMNGMADALDKLCFIGRVETGPLLEGLLEKFFPKDLGSLGLPQLLAGDRFDDLVSADPFHGARGSDGRNYG